MYKNNSRIGTGLRSTTSIDPRALAEDITNRVHILKPQATPLDSIFRSIGRGKTPVNHKITTMQYHEFDPIDYCSQTVMDANLPVGWERFARLKLDQPSRPLTNDQMWYAGGDKLHIQATGQTVQVFMTSSSAIELNDTTLWTDPTAGTVSGSTATATLQGWVLVRNIEEAPLIPFATSTIVYLGNQLRESQRITTPSRQRDILYDFNLVEHKDATVSFTEDQAKWVKTKLTTPDLNFQQTENLSEFKLAIEYNKLFSERATDFRDTSRPSRSMRGLVKHIESNVAIYNPQAVFNFETMMQNFILNQAFRYNPNGAKKFAICGGGFLAQFNQTFASLRRIEKLPMGNIGLDLDTYDFTGFSLSFMRSDIFAQDTPYWWWCLVIDPLEAEERIVKDYATRPLFQNNDERDMKFMVEWQGSIAWNIEQAHALLRTA
jgi:hypothetical protein